MLLPRPSLCFKKEILASTAKIQNLWFAYTQHLQDTHVSSRKICLSPSSPNISERFKRHIIILTNPFSLFKAATQKPAWSHFYPIPDEGAMCAATNNNDATFIMNWPSDPVLCTFANFILSIPYNNSVRVALSVDSAIPNTGASFTQCHHAVNTNIFISTKILKTSPQITDTASSITRFQIWEQAWEKLAAMRRRQVYPSSLHACFLGYRVSLRVLIFSF